MNSPMLQASLPTGGDLPVEHLSFVFASNSTSYKHCLLKAILTLSCEGKQVSRISFIDLRREMLATAWIPRLCYRLKFGQVDKSTQVLDTLAEHCEKEGLTPELNIDDIRKIILKLEPSINAMPIAPMYKNLVRFAPYRMLAPWFEKETRGMDGHVKDQLIAKLSRSRFSTAKPLYRIVTKGKRFIELHPEWHAYFRDNYRVIMGWLDMHWLRYLEPRNSGVLNLVDKLWVYKGQREALTKQRKFWQPVLAQDFRCIYTGAPVIPSHFALDHFLPWKCVAHNRLWNLVPTAPEFNSSKSDRLPMPEHVDVLAEAHLSAIKHDLSSSKPTKNALLEYADWLDLAIEPTTFDEGSFRHVYAEKMTNHLGTARLQGFREMNLA